MFRAGDHEVWIGLTKPMDLCGDDTLCRQKGWNWEDGSTYNSAAFHRWYSTYNSTNNNTWTHSTQDKVEEKTYLCARLYQSKWYERPCLGNGNNTFPCACEKRVVTSESGCPFGEKKHRHGCYSMKSKLMSYQECEESCKKDKGGIISIANQKEQEFVAHL